MIIRWETLGSQGGNWLRISVIFERYNSEKELLDDNSECGKELRKPGILQREEYEIGHWEALPSIFLSSLKIVSLRLIFF